MWRAHAPLIAVIKQGNSDVWGLLATEEMELKVEIHMKGEDSLTTKETKEAVQQKHSKEVFENKDATKKPNFRNMKQKHLKHKDEEHKEGIKLKDVNHSDEIGTLPKKEAVQQKPPEKGVGTRKATVKKNRSS